MSDQLKTKKRDTNPPGSFWSIVSGAPMMLGYASGSMLMGALASGSWTMGIVAVACGTLAFIAAGIVYERFIRHG